MKTDTQITVDNDFQVGENQYISGYDVYSGKLKVCDLPKVDVDVNADLDIAKN
jgi:hypothetical protein